MVDRYEQLFERLQFYERKIKELLSDRRAGWEDILCSPVYQPIAGLLQRRQETLDKMFEATPEEVERMAQVNEVLLELTKKMFTRTEELYHKMVNNTYDPEFDNDVDVEGTLKFEFNGPDSILPMRNDDYYGSDFALMFEVIDHLYTHNRNLRAEIEQSYCYCHPNTYRADISRRELRIAENPNDGKSWYEECQSAADKLSHICICHAIYDLNMHKPYSIPDILRMNDFSVEMTVKHQHFGKVKSINN